jgi:outer membrane protein assembly factor BamD
MLAACGGQMNLANLDARTLLDLGMKNYENKKYLRATEAFQAVIFNFPGETYVDTAQYYLALSYFGEKSYVLAQVEFSRLLMNYPSSAFASQAQLMKGVCFYKGTPEDFGLDQTDLETAVSQLQDFITDYPESEAIDDARAYLAEARHRLAQKKYASGVLYTRMRDYRAARIYFQQVIDEYTDSEFAPEATYLVAETYFKEKKWDEAHERFENFKIVFSDHEWASKAGELACEAAYKGGREALEKGEAGLARTRFERFLSVCGDESEKGAEVRQLLIDIGDLPIVEVDSSDAGS